MKIIFDSGIRTGSDVFKALALGAHAVQVGRLYVWGMAHEGEAGCRHVMKSLLAVRLVHLATIGQFFAHIRMVLVGIGYPDDCRRLSVHHERCEPQSAEV